MKTTIRIFSLALALAFAGGVQAQECSRPAKPNVPDGASAERKEMVQAQQAVQKYVKAMEGYLACIDKRQKAAMKKAKANDEKLSAERRKALGKRYNTGVKNLKTIAQEFNKQLKAYQKAQGN